MGNGKRTTALKAVGTCLLSLAALAACGGDLSTNSTGTAVVNTPANAAPTLPPGQAPLPEVTLTGNLAERTNQKRSIDIPASGPPPTPGHFDAPEDSTVTTSMNREGQVFEMRVFKSHPQLAKVESTWTGPQERRVKLFLRDGNNRELTTDRLPNLRSATAAEMLALVGIRAAQPSTAEKGETGVKKRQ